MVISFYKHRSQKAKQSVLPSFFKLWKYSCSDTVLSIYLFCQTRTLELLHFTLVKVCSECLIKLPGCVCNTSSELPRSQSLWDCICSLTGSESVSNAPGVTRLHSRLMDQLSVLSCPAEC